MDKPQTRAEAQKRVYGKWAGNPTGHPYDPKCCAENVGRNVGRWTQFGQCTKKPGHGPDKLYCKQHDPAEEAKRAAAKEAKYQANRERERPGLYAYRMLDIIRKIAGGHNDPSALCREFLKDYDKKD